jgi:hypothetical protein
LEHTPSVCAHGTGVALKSGMLVIAEQIRSADEDVAPEAYRRVDDDMLESGVVMQTAWAWALYGAAVVGSVGLYFVYTPRCARPVDSAGERR